MLKNNTILVFMCFILRMHINRKKPPLGENATIKLRISHYNNCLIIIIIIIWRRLSNVEKLDSLKSVTERKLLTNIPILQFSAEILKNSIFL